MKKKITISIILLIILAIALGLSILFGLNISIKVLLICMLADYLIGIAMAISGNSKHGGLKSYVGYTGIVKKAIMIFIVVIMGLLEQLLNINFLQKTITVAFIFNEVVSILENADRVGVPINKMLKIFDRKGEQNDKNK